MEELGKWALIGFDGKAAILISNEIYIDTYMGACKIAELKAREKGLECGMAIEMKSIWGLIKESAKCYNQEVL